MGMSSNLSRPLDSGRKDALGRTVRVSGTDAGRRSDAPPPPTETVEVDAADLAAGDTVLLWGEVEAVEPQAFGVKVRFASGKEWLAAPGVKASKVAADTAPVEAAPAASVAGPTVQEPERFPSVADQFRNLAAAGADPRRADYREAIRAQMLVNARQVVLARAGAPVRLAHLSDTPMRDWAPMVRERVRSQLAGS